MRSKAWSGRRPAASIFSVSFLDLLACTLGSLIFIMILLFMHTTNMMDPNAAPPAVRAMEDRLNKANEAAARQEKELADVTRRAAEVRSDLEAAKEEEKRLSGRLAASPADRERLAREEAATLEGKISALEKDVAELKRQLEEERAKREQLERKREAISKSSDGRKLFVPVRETGNPIAANFTDIYHVICDREGVTIKHESPGPSKLFGEKVPKARLKEAKSAFMAAVADVGANRRTHTMILWVRPDGFESYFAAKSVTDDAKINIGDAPLDADREPYIERKEK